MGSNWRCNSSPQGEVDRGEGPGTEGVNGASVAPHSPHPQRRRSGQDADAGEEAFQLALGLVGEAHGQGDRAILGPAPLQHTAVTV